MDGFLSEKERQPPAPGAAAGSSARRRAKPAAVARQAAFDHWLQQELTRLYGAALHEPLPDSLLRLLDERLPPKGD